MTQLVNLEKYRNKKLVREWTDCPHNPMFTVSMDLTILQKESHATVRELYLKEYLKDLKELHMGIPLLNMKNVSLVPYKTELDFSELFGQSLIVSRLSRAVQKIFPIVFIPESEVPILAKGGEYELLGYNVTMYTKLTDACMHNYN